MGLGGWCKNIKGGCSHWDPGVTLDPGEWQKVKTILPDRDAYPFHFSWQWGTPAYLELDRDSVAVGEALPKPGLGIEFGTLRVGWFDVGPDQAYGLTGHYLGRISLLGDTITVQVESGLIRNRIIPDGPQMRLVGIRLGLRPWINEGAEGLVASGEVEEFQIDLGPGGEKAVGAFELSVVYDANLSFAHKLFFIHEVRMEDGRMARTFTSFPGTVGDLIWGGHVALSGTQETPLDARARIFLTDSSSLSSLIGLSRYPSGGGTTRW